MEKAEIIVDEGIEINSVSPYIKIKNTRHDDVNIELFTMGSTLADCNHECFQICSTHDEIRISNHSSGIGKTKPITIQSGDGKIQISENGIITVSGVEIQNGNIKCKTIMLGKCELSSTTSSLTNTPESPSTSLIFPSYSTDKLSCLNVNESGKISYFSPIHTPTPPPPPPPQPFPRLSIPLKQPTVIYDDDIFTCNKTTDFASIKEFISNISYDDNGVLKISNDDNKGVIKIPKAAIGTKWVCDFYYSFIETSELIISCYDGVFEFVFTTTKRQNEYMIMVKYLGETIRKSSIMELPRHEQKISIVFDWYNSKTFSIWTNDIDVIHDHRIPFDFKPNMVSPFIFNVSGKKLKIHEIYVQRFHIKKTEKKGEFHIPNNDGSSKYVNLKADCLKSYTLTLPRNLPEVVDDDMFLTSDKFGNMKWKRISETCDLETDLKTLSTLVESLRVRLSNIEKSERIVT